VETSPAKASPSRARARELAHDREMLIRISGVVSLMDTTLRRLFYAVGKKLPNADPTVLVRPFEILRKIREKLVTITADILKTCSPKLAALVQPECDVFFFHMLDILASVEQAIAKAKIAHTQIDIENGLPELQKKVDNFHELAKKLSAQLHAAAGLPAATESTVRTDPALPAPSTTPASSSSEPARSSDDPPSVSHQAIFSKLDLITRTLSNLHDVEHL
jgi:hypothetical protein